ncbi:hypothetical protein [Brevundimonas sp.]|uniref:hypothetical protein n=1 Tax=Brevundimonas sp. TaxID=1871086 RepID=UPI0039193C53
MTRLWISASAIGALLLAACSGEDPPAAQPPVRGPDSAIAAEQPFHGAGWSLVASGEGVALRLAADGEVIAGVACMRGPARLQVESDRFQPIMSEDRFTVGAGDEAYALAADLAAERERGVEASGEISVDLLDRLEAGGAIAFNYGAQSLGPFPAVPEAYRDAFVAVCREIAG